MVASKKSSSSSESSSNRSANGKLRPVGLAVSESSDSAAENVKRLRIPDPRI